MPRKKLLPNLGQSSKIEMWAAIDYLVPAPRGANTFTNREFAERYHLTKGAAQRQIAKLLRDHLITMTRRSQLTFYTWENK